MQYSHTTVGLVRVAEDGSRGATVYRNAKDRNDVVMVFDWDDQKPYTGYFGLPDVQKALAETGTTEFIEVNESFRIDA